MAEATATAETTEKPTDAGTIPAEVVEETTPATPEVPEETPSEEPSKPLTKQEARQALQEDRAKEQKSAEETTEEPETPATDTAAEEGTTTEEAEKPSETETETAAKPIEIKIGDDHPVRKMGLESLTANSEHEERVIRALINGTYARRQDLAQAQSENATLREELRGEREQRIRREATDTVSQNWRSTPEYKAAYEQFQEIKESIGQEQADTFWRGVETNLRSLTDQEYKTRMEAVATEDQARQARAFGEAAWRQANELPEHIRTLTGFQGWFNEELASFGTAMTMGRYAELERIEDPVERTEKLQDAFRKFLGSRLIREPEVTAAYQKIKAEEARQNKDASATAEAAERERKAIADKAVDQFKKSIADNRAETPPHPLGNLGSGVPRESDSQGSSDDGKSLVNQSAHELKREQKRLAREDTRKRFAR